MTKAGICVVLYCTHPSCFSRSLRQSVFGFVVVSSFFFSFFVVFFRSFSVGVLFVCCCSRSFPQVSVGFPFRSSDHSLSTGIPFQLFFRSFLHSLFGSFGPQFWISFSFCSFVYAVLDFCYVLPVRSLSVGLILSLSLWNFDFFVVLLNIGFPFRSTRSFPQCWTSVTFFPFAPSMLD